LCPSGVRKKGIATIRSTARREWSRASQSSPSPARGGGRLGAMCGEPSLTKCSQYLRRGMTAAKRALWRELRCDQLGRRFRRQHPILPYIADFACVDAKNSLSRRTANNTPTVASRVRHVPATARLEDLAILEQ